MRQLELTRLDPVVVVMICLLDCSHVDRVLFEALINRLLVSALTLIANEIETSVSMAMIVYGIAAVWIVS